VTLAIRGCAVKGKIAMIGLQFVVETPVDQPLNLLLVEDSPDDRDLILLELRRAGFEARWRQVATSEELRDALTSSWDLVLCDYHMPRFSGLAALEIIRAHDADLPLIIVSGVLGEEAAVAAMKAGAHDFFSKSKLARLGAAIERELKDASVRRQRTRAEQEKARLFKDLERALHVRDEFLVLASHEFRTPLTVLRLQADGLARTGHGPPADTGADEVRRQRIGRLTGQIDRMSQLIERLLDVTKLSSEPLRLVRTRTDLRALVLEVVERSRDWIDEAGCALNLQPMEEAIGCWDRVRLDSVVTNLIANALKYGAGNPVTLSVERRDGFARLAVVDQGIGISDEDQMRLFEKFARVVPNRNYGGFGLGLWIVAELVRAHGGTIEVHSQKGRGATFTVQLPTGEPEAGVVRP
jgi:signal transduction histidine kinase